MNKYLNKYLFESVTSIEEYKILFTGLFNTFETTFKYMNISISIFKNGSLHITNVIFMDKSISSWSNKLNRPGLPNKFKRHGLISWMWSIIVLCKVFTKAPGLWRTIFPQPDNFVLSRDRLRRWRTRP